VEGGPAPSEIVVIERGEVVVDETEGVDEFDGRRRIEGVVRIAADGLAGKGTSAGRSRLPPPRTAYRTASASPPGRSSAPRRRSR
jgi:hypothetical protein